MKKILGKIADRIYHKPRLKISSAVSPLLIPRMVNILKKRSAALADLDSVLDFALKFKIYGTPIKPLQIRGEFKRLMEIVQAARPKAIVELGTAMGGTLFCFARVADPSATLISLDLPSGQGGYLEWKKPLLEAFALPE
ncbi:MAG TPA: hypothetical protein VNK24_01910 [Elusimicrobiota bacterium]|nr:hypothetical protein [Elusimicrobiota bacterium]